MSGRRAKKKPQPPQPPEVLELPADQSGSPQPGERIFCTITQTEEDAVSHIARVCKFYAGQPYRPSLGNSDCHDSCPVPKRYEVPRLVRRDENQ